MARDLLGRDRLSAYGPDLRDRPAILVQAPAGFGKTSLLAQWRREHLAHGTVVAWLSAVEDDEPQRFVQGLTMAVMGDHFVGYVAFDTVEDANRAAAILGDLGAEGA